MLLTQGSFSLPAGLSSLGTSPSRCTCTPTEEYWVQVQDPLLIVHQGALNQREDVEVFGHSNVLNTFTILVNWIDDGDEGVPLLLTTASAGAA